MGGSGGKNSTGRKIEYFAQRAVIIALFLLAVGSSFGAIELGLSSVAISGAPSVSLVVVLCILLMFFVPSGSGAIRHMEEFSGELWSIASGEATDRFREQVSSGDSSDSSSPSEANNDGSNDGEIEGTEQKREVMTETDRPD